MSESFHSKRYGKVVWLTNHAIESMSKRKITLGEVKALVEQGTDHAKGEGHGWISHHFPSRDDNLICAAVLNEQALIIKTVMIHWKPRALP